MPATDSPQPEPQPQQPSSSSPSSPPPPPPQYPGTQAQQAVASVGTAITAPGQARMLPKRHLGDGASPAMRRCDELMAQASPAVQVPPSPKDDVCQMCVDFMHARRTEGTLS